MIKYTPLSCFWSCRERIPSLTINYDVSQGFVLVWFVSFCFYKCLLSGWGSSMLCLLTLVVMSLVSFSILIIWIFQSVFFSQLNNFSLFCGGLSVLLIFIKNHLLVSLIFCFLLLLFSVLLISSQIFTISSALLVWFFFLMSKTERLVWFDVFSLI